MELFTPTWVGKGGDRPEAVSLLNEVSRGVTVSVNREGVRILLGWFAVALEGNLTGYVVPVTFRDIEGLVMLVEPHPSSHKGPPGSRGLAVPLRHVLSNCGIPEGSTSLNVCSRQGLQLGRWRSTTLYTLI